MRRHEIQMTDKKSMAGGHEAVSGEPTTERVRGIFGRIAESYDAFNLLSSMGFDRGWRRAAVRATQLTPGSVVLDICSGTGDLALALAARGVARRVEATDFSPEMLAVASRKAPKIASQTEVSFSVADAQALPFADASFDVVTVAFGVRNLPDRAANFREVLRVLRPGGRYVILEFSTPGWAPWRAVYHLYLGYVIPLLGSLLTRGDRASFEYLNASIRSFPDQSSLARELELAGFASAEWKNLTGGIVAIHSAVK